MSTGSLPQSILERIEAVRDAFEAAWREGRRCRIEDFLEEADLGRPDLLRSLIVFEWEFRRSEGDLPTLGEYIGRFPGEAEFVRRAFGETEPAPSSQGPSTSIPEALANGATATAAPSGPRHEQDTDGRPHASSTFPARIDEYRPIREVAYGTFGVVYYAWDELCDRPVALKVARPGALGGRDREEALLTEARLAASLRHQGIVTVYRVGRIDGGGVPFLALEFVEGPTLEKVFRDEGRLPLDRLATLVAKLADAIRHAHERRVIHRDLKPANILIDASGEPRVADFGLALHEDGRRPREGEVAGTARYMAPEQVRGESHRLDGRTDLWALGAIFYEGLTGRRPFSETTKAAIFAAILGREPTPPREVDGRIPAELERICLKCLSKQMSDRYGSAKALAEDLRAWLAAPLVATVAGPAAAADGPARVPPKGLRAFDQGDADPFLALMPGPRGRDGVPDSIRAWRSRIDGLEGGAEPFTVGLLHGPSGGGKSSFVRAGLLPRLDPGLAVICLDATPFETEGRLLAALRRRVPRLAEAEDLPEAVADLRARGVEPWDPGGKVLIVLDQFEQWLQAHPAGPDDPLVRALRQCDGRHVQALVLVRDDFWTSVARFFRALEVPLVEGLNSSPVELPDARHARTVLEAFGRAWDRFTGPGGGPSAEEGKFLEAAADGLAGRDGRVYPIRLSLLAEVVRRRSWTPATLEELGGVRGIGLTYLTEAFDAPTSPPHYKVHSKAAGAALQALLPAEMSVLKAPARPASELREAAGYADRPDLFGELMAVLDRDLRLISVVEPESPDPSGLESGEFAKPAAGPSYQLAHDVLVEPIRQWAERKLRSTRAGRAGLRLASISASYAERPERRRLPSTAEWLSILASIRPSRWTAAERSMMKAATLLHLGRATAALLVAGAVGLGVSEVRARDHARSLFDRAMIADPGTFKGLMPEIKRHLSRLRDRAERIEARSRRDSREFPKACEIAYLARPTAARADFLRGRLLAAPPEEVEVIGEALAAHPEHAMADILRARLSHELTGPRARLGIAASLARLDPASPVELGPATSTVALALLGEERRSVPLWLDLLGPATSQIAPTLEDVCADPDREPAARSNAAEALGALYYRRRDPLGRPDSAGLAMAMLRALPDAAVVLIQELRRFDDPTPATEALRAALASPPADPADDVAAESLASRQATAAVALAALGRADFLAPLLRHRDDPRLRTRVIHALARSDVVAKVAAARLDRQPAEVDPGERQAYLMALAEANLDPPAALADRVATLYAEDPDSGVHSAAWLLLRRWHRDELIARGDGQVRQKPPAEPADRGWIVGPNGHTFVVLRGPLAFRMGSPVGEAGRFPRETAHIRKVDRSIAVAITEVTLAQYRKYRPDYAPDPRYGNEADGPAHEVNWFDAIRYCNRLSLEAGLEPCYPEPAKGPDGREQVVLPDDIASKPGFRLPTEAEFEYFCRAGTSTSRPFGSSDEFIPLYAWTYLNSGHRCRPVATLLPNPFGLFDALGNIWEWSHDGAPPAAPPPDPFAAYPQGTVEVPAADPSPGGTVAYPGRRMLRGGGFSYAPVEARSASRYGATPVNKEATFGLRVVRTLH